MRNAPVSALIYELLFNVYEVIEKDLRFVPALRDENGVERDTFFHSFIGKWEGSSYILEAAGVLKKLPSSRKAKGPFFHPLMTLDECLVADFSSFENFNNYCFAMHAFHEFLDGIEVEQAEWSPHFLAEVAEKDDIFRIVRWQALGEVQILLKSDRFEGKVMRHWPNVSAFEANTERLNHTS